MKIGFIADIHEDYKSLQEAFSILDKFECDVIVCLGDIVGFTLPFQKKINNRDANECIKLIKEKCAVTVVGNHDLHAIKKIPEYSAGFHFHEDWYDLDANTRAALSKDYIWIYEENDLPISLTQESKAFLNSLPEYSITTFDGITFLFSHFNYPNLSGSTIKFPTKVADLKSHFNFMREFECIISVSGHGHPEGFIFTSPKKFKFYPFGSYKLKHEIQGLICPCVASTNRLNGVMVLDTSTLQLDVIPLNSPKHFISYLW